MQHLCTLYMGCSIFTEDERMPLKATDARSFETNPQIIHDVIDFTVSWSVGNISRLELCVKCKCSELCRELKCLVETIKLTHIYHHFPTGVSAGGWAGAGRGTLQTFRLEIFA